MEDFLLLLCFTVFLSIQLSLCNTDARYAWQMVEARFKELLHHSSLLLKKKWLFGIIDEFITKQLPHNVTWGLSLLYAMEHKGDRALTSTQGDTQTNYEFVYSCTVLILCSNYHLLFLCPIS